MRTETIMEKTGMIEGYLGEKLSIGVDEGVSSGFGNCIGGGTSNVSNA